VTEKRRETNAAAIERVLNDPERLARVAVREAEREIFWAGIRKELEPLVIDLRATGLTLETLFELSRSPEDLRVAFPVLLEHLKRPYSDKARWHIAHRFETKEARPHWDAIVALYGSTTDDPKIEHETWRRRLANAIAIMATKSDYLVLERLLTNQMLGRDRIMLIPIVIRLGRGKAWQLLQTLEKDPHLYKEIAYRQKEKARRERAKQRRASQ
jgi:hypothetical protein